MADAPHDELSDPDLRRATAFDAGVSRQAIRLAKALEALADQLPNPWDESTDYFHGFAAALPATTALDAEAFRRALGVGARYEIHLSSAEDRLTALGNAQADWGDDIAGGFRQLAHVMHATLGELSLAFARGKGVVRVRLWLFGRSRDGMLVGLRSLSTET
ncbi:MAG: hypothetical protein H7138_28250 [Myxococcales bacterium]|nr:hypothetical protein [Myxococcales bacterium]